MPTDPGLAELLAPLHAMLRRETPRLPVAVGAVTIGDVVAAVPVATWAFDVLDVGHHHLTALAGVEASLAGTPRPPVGIVPVLHVVAVVQAGLIRWQDRAAAAEQKALVAGFAEVVPAMLRTLDRIETDLAPPAAAILPGRAARVVAAQGIDAIAGARRRLAVLGAVLAASAPDTGELPLPAAGALTRRRALAEYRRRTAAVDRAGGEPA